MHEVQGGATLPGLYPPNAENKARYEAERQSETSAVTEMDGGRFFGLLLLALMQFLTQRLILTDPYAASETTHKTIVC